MDAFILIISTIVAITPFVALLVYRRSASYKRALEKKNPILDKVGIVLYGILAFIPITLLLVVSISILGIILGLLFWFLIGRPSA